MSDEELNALVERLDGMGRVDGVLTLSLTTIIAVSDAQSAASAIRQLMRERDEARKQVEDEINSAWCKAVEEGERD